MQRVQAQIEPTVQDIGQALLKAPVVGANETGVRVAEKLHWLHVLCTATLVYVKRHAKRGKEAFDAIGLLQHYLGVLVHGGWKPYWLLACMHASAVQRPSFAGTDVPGRGVQAGLGTRDDGVAEPGLP